MACLQGTDPKLCALCRDPFVMREVRRIYPSVNLDDATDAARVEEAVIKAIDDCQPEMFESAARMLQKWLEKGSAAHASFQSTVIRLNTYMKTMNRLSKAYGDMCQYEAVVRSMDDQKRQFEEERTALQDEAVKGGRKVELAEHECQQLHVELKKRNQEVVIWKTRCRQREDELKELKLELFDLEKLSRVSKEEAHNHETDALRWRRRYEQAIAELSDLRPPLSRAASSSGFSFTTGYAF